ncbi:tetratricopeptide repeat protein [Methylotenera sp. G11]|uniref:tetratricopeptide repeat protein n=1 Tax=Methylotenera sp. G11 TaxID=1506585 RepID=UPI000691284D|nr:tetratricopeptide repeat protein [Methylotenera sp. G11]
MLKKLVRLFSQDKSPDHPINDAKDGIQHQAPGQDLSLTAAELKDAGDQAFRAGNLSQAEVFYTQSLGIDANQPATYNNRGIALYYLNRFEEALASYQHAISLKPDYAQAYNNQGIVLNDMQRPDEALASYERAITLKPDYAEAYYNRGIAHNKLEQPDETLASYDRAIALKPDYAEAYYNRGLLLNHLKRFDEALADYDRAIALRPDHAETHNNRGVVLDSMKRFAEALVSYDHALTLRPDHAETYNNRGTALSNLKRLDEAVASYDRAIALKPDYAEAYNNLGLALYDLQRWDKALANYDRAIAINPDYAEAYYNKGIVLNVLKRLDEALASYDRATVLDPDYADAHYNRGMILNDLNRPDEALASYDRAFALMPDHDFLYGYWIHSRMQLCNWSNYDNQMKLLADKIEQNEKTTPPFVVLAQSSSRSLQKKAAEIYVQSLQTSNDTPPAAGKHDRHQKIRIGYFSADFRNHPLAFLTAELFETHDRSRFELIAFYFGPETKDDMRSRVEAAFDQFIDVRQLSDMEISAMARKLEIDIAVDLGGFTAKSRTGVFALRAAPLQVSYLGYLGTLGAGYMDYLIADATMVPPEHRKDYTEKIIYLPSYQVNDSKRRISEKVFTREELGLPATGFVFCCFNNNYKITPHTFDCWMRILQQVAHSVLWLVGDNATTENNLRAEATHRGIDARRLVFAKRLPLPEYLARFRVADLFLDTTPYNAGATASDALWAGLPVLTYLGETFAGRMAASLLNAIHLPELITATPQEYEAEAIALATQPGKLSEIKQKLAENRLTTPLFDTQHFCNHIEAAYTQIYERYQAGLMPDHIIATVNDHERISP